MSSGSQQHERVGQRAAQPTAVRNMLLILMAGAAGSVDAISYAGFGRVFTANMTGNTVLLGLALAQVEPQGIYFSGAALVGFVTGTAVGTWIAGPPHQQNTWSGRMTMAAMIEVVVLIGVLICWSIDGEPLPQVFWRPVLIAATALAMGIQSAAVHHLSIAGISTTYITSTITSLVAEVVSGRAAVYQANQSHRDNSWLLFAVWLMYLGSAAGTAALLNWAQNWTMLVPIVLVLLTIIGALARYGINGGTPGAVSQSVGHNR